MHQPSTYSETLIQLKKYYKAIFLLNQHKKDYAFLGFPFGTEQAYTHTQYEVFDLCKLVYVLGTNQRVNETILTRIYDNILTCFATETEYDVVRCMFYFKGIIRPTHSDPLGEHAHLVPDRSVLGVSEFAGKLKHYESFFHNKFHQASAKSDWEPNT